MANLHRSTQRPSQRSERTRARSSGKDHGETEERIDDTSRFSYSRFFLFIHLQIQFDVTQNFNYEKRLSD